MVEKFVTITPNNAILRGFVGDQLKTTVKIIPEDKYPFKIIESKAIDGKNIRFKLEEHKLSKGIEYVLTVENLKKDKGRYYDNISLKTDSKIRPMIRIRVNGTIRDRQPGTNK
jgi:hypothetical protein